MDNSKRIVTLYTTISNLRGLMDNIGPKPDVTFIDIMNVLFADRANITNFLFARKKIEPFGSMEYLTEQRVNKVREVMDDDVCGWFDDCKIQLHPEFWMVSAGVAEQQEISKNELIELVISTKDSFPFHYAVSFTFTAALDFPRSYSEPEISETRFEMEFPVAEILKVMQEKCNRNVKYICHAICYMIGGDGNSDIPYHGSYIYASHHFPESMRAFGQQVIEQTRPFVEKLYRGVAGDSSLLQGGDALFDAFDDGVDREHVLQYMLKENPKASIKISINVPMDFPPSIMTGSFQSPRLR